MIPPCPQLLVQLQDALAQVDPDPHRVVDISSSDVAMAAALIKMANSSFYARREAVNSVAQVGVV